MEEADQSHRPSVRARFLDRPLESTTPSASADCRVSGQTIDLAGSVKKCSRKGKKGRATMDAQGSGGTVVPCGTYVGQKNGFDMTKGRARMENSRLQATPLAYI